MLCLSEETLLLGPTFLTFPLARYLWDFELNTFTIPLARYLWDFELNTLTIVHLFLDQSTSSDKTQNPRPNIHFWALPLHIYRLHINLKSYLMWNFWSNNFLKKKNPNSFLICVGLKYIDLG